MEFSVKKHGIWVCPKMRELSNLWPCAIWGWVKTLVPSEPQNSWDLWMFIPLKMVSIAIDPYSYVAIHGNLHRDH